MGYSSGGGGQQTSTPLTAAQMAERFNSALALIQKYTGGNPTSTTTSNYRGPTGTDMTPEGESYFADLGYNAPEGFYSPFSDPGAAALSSGYREYTSPGSATANPEFLGFNDPGVAAQLYGGDYDKLQQALLEARTAPLGRYETLAREQTDEDLAKRGIYSSGLATRAQGDVTERLAPLYEQAGAEAVAQRYGLQSSDLNALRNYALSRSGMANTYNQGLNALNLQNTEGLRNYALNSAGMANTFNQGLNALSQQDLESLRSYALQRAGMFNTFNQTADAAKNALAMENASRSYSATWRPLDWLSGLYNGQGGQVSVGTSGGGWGFTI